MENKLIEIKTNDKGESLVSARELYDFLGLSKRFSAWIETYIGNEDYGFVENEDFTSVLTSTVVNNGAKRELQDYALTLDMAKELSMLSKTEKGKKARKYFIEVERAWNSPEMIMKRALEIANKKVEQLQLENNHKQEVIQGFTDNISISDKRSILNKVIRKGGKYKERYSALYQTYKDTYHIDIKKRFENYNINNSPKCKSVLDYADKHLNAIGELYNIACKLFESDVDKLVNEMYSLR